MKIVINIPDDFKDYIEDILMGVGDDKTEMLVNAVMNGTPLPKGHGAIVDTNQLNMWDIRQTPIIILAEKGE